MKKRASRMILMSGLPEDALTGCARVTMSGRSAALIEGQHGVVELGDTRIRLKTQDGVLAVTGEALHLQELSLDAALIRGARLDAVSYGRADT